MQGAPAKLSVDARLFAKKEMTDLADSNITKKALATALKELMSEKTFSKISVSDICDKCNMNRKSFYYHFKDKYDLVNWIFDTEFICAVNEKISYDGWELLEILCNYFYEHRDFYRKALKIEGQNSFSEHFSEYLRSFIKKQLEIILKGSEVTKFHIDFFADGFIGAITRWIIDKNCVPPEAFLSLLKSCLISTAISISKDLEQENQN